MDNAVAFSGATGGLSTEKAASPKLLSVRHANHTGRGTGLSALQVAVSIDEKAVVHKKGLALLLLLFIYKTLKEQPKNILGAPKPVPRMPKPGGDGKVLATEVAFGKTKVMFRRQLRLSQTPCRLGRLQIRPRSWRGRSKPLFRPPGPPKRWHRRHAGPQSRWKGRCKARAAHPLAGRPPRPLVRPFKGLEQVVSRDCVG